MEAPPQSHNSIPLLRACCLTKVFPGKVANRNVSIDVFPGEVHALLGENGAGKSTLVGMLAGILERDGGEILWKGYATLAGGNGTHPVPYIGMVHQHFSLVPSFTLVENLMLLESFSLLRPFLCRTKVSRRIDELESAYGISVRRDVPIGRMSVGEQQLCELLKALYHDCELLILDEPTAVLTPSEIENLWRIIGGFRASGKAVIIIAHKISEIMRIADRVSVLRDGEMVHSGLTTATTASSLAELMVGREVHAVSAGRELYRGDVVLELKEVALAAPRGGIALKGLNLSLKAGEIVGVAGVDGNGQTELFHMLARGTKPDDGAISLAGREIRCFGDMLFSDVRVGRIPDDRQRYGVVMDMSVQANLMLMDGIGVPYSRKGIRQLGKWRSRSKELVADYDVRCSGIFASARSLSGGNQQKLILAREFSGNPGLLLITNPTRGLDMGAMEMIHKRIVEAARRGCAVLLLSSDLDEILALCDRTVVMHSGSFIGEATGPAYDIKTIGLWMAGQKEVLS